MKISIVTPNYNYADYIGDTIRSVVTQDYPEIEHIIIDDGSTDRSAEVIEHWKKKYPDRINATLQANAGQTPAINVGLQKVTGDIIGWINSDDVYEPHVFKRVTDYFSHHPEVDIVYGNANIVDENLSPIYCVRHLPFNYRMGAYLGFSRMVTSNAIFWRKQAMDRSGLLREDLKWNMDGEFFSRLTYSARLAHLPFPFASFRNQPRAKTSDIRPEWKIIQQHEVALELEGSFRQLSESRWMPCSFKRLIRLYYKIRRIAARVILFHYFRRWNETRCYKRKTGLLT